MSQSEASDKEAAAVQQKEDQQERQWLVDLELDQTKLAAAITSGQGEVYLLQWLSKAERALKSISAEALTPEQTKLHTTLSGLISPPPPSSDDAGKKPKHPAPGRPVRQLLARCYVLSLSKVPSRSLFDILQSLLAIAGDEGKGGSSGPTPVPEREAKVASLFVAGEIFAALGQNVMSLFLELTALCQKLLKNYSLAPILRFHAMLCLEKALKTGAKSLNDQPGKELVKALRLGLGDKAGAVVRGCAQCLRVLLEETYFLSNRAEIETLLAAGVRALETADFVTKRSVSRLCAELLASTQKPSSAPPPPAPSARKGGKRKEGAEDDSDDEAGGTPAAGSSAAAEASRAILTPAAMLDGLASPFGKPVTTRKARIALFDVYATLFEVLGAAWVQANYGLVIRHLFEDLPNQARSTSTRAEVLVVRTGVSLIARKVIGELMLGEQAQVAAIQEICSIFVKRFPMLTPGQTPPSKYSLTLALDECAALVAQLGSVPDQVHDALYDAVIRCLAHPSHSVQISSAWCLRTICSVSASQLSPALDQVLELLGKDLASLKTGSERVGAETSRKTIGHARALAALVAVIPSRPLYVSFEASSKVLDLAISLLKDSADHDLSVASIEIQTAWTLIAALMALGPNFTRDHLGQLLVLWRNALPKASPQDTQQTAPGTGRSDGEWAFLLTVRECALTAVWAFLTYNGSALLTLDSAKRIIVLLSNTLTFINGFAAQRPHLSQEQVPGAERSVLSLLDREHMVRRRLLQCFTIVAANPALEPLADSLIPAALQTFAEPERYVGSSAQAAIAASSGSFSGIWSVPDGYAYGVTTLQRDSRTFASVHGDDEDATTSSSGVPASTDATCDADWLNRDAVENQLEALQRRPVLGSAEHDVAVIFAPSRSTQAEAMGVAPRPPPPATAMVDAAIELFAALLPYRGRPTQVSAVEALLNHSRSNKLERNPGRRIAVQLNSCVAIVAALRVAMQSGGSRKAAGFNNDRLSMALRELLKDAIVHGDLALHSVAGEAFGRLAAVAGSHAMSSQVQFLVDQVVANRDPDARAGCALAFGRIYAEVGGLAAGPLTKTVVNILMSLSTDPHPMVHYSALNALCLVVDAASLSYAPFVASTLGMLAKLYMLDTHEPEGGSAGSGNLRADLPAYQAACKVMSALVGVLGPDLQESAKVRGLLLTLMLELSRERDDGVAVEATKAMQHFALFAPAHLDATLWIEALRGHLRSAKRPLKASAVNALYQLVQRQALLVSRVGGDSLVAELFAQLDNDPTIEGVREVLLSWLRQTAELSPTSWIDLCQRIMSKTAGSKRAAPAQGAPAPQNQIGVLQDEEAATLDLGDDGAGRSLDHGQSRWRTQLFALQCLHEVFLAVRRSGRLEHFAAPVGPNARQLMSSRVSDLIRMAFTASTSANAEIRLEGLTVLRDVIDNFKAARDPDFNEALLLEQHQAPITAALTPAFATDSTPAVLSAAIQVCAAFVGCGVVQEIDKMGRILKQLVSALESCMDPDMEALGEVKGLSANAAAVLKVSVFTAWGELKVASRQQAYLGAVLKPHLAALSTFWVAALREYARIRGDPRGEGMGMMGSGPVINPTLDSQYSGLAREVLMPYYEQAWARIMHAVAELMSEKHPSITLALEGHDARSDASSVPAPSSFRSEPCANFFVVYGLAFEALAISAGASSTTGASASSAANAVIALQSLRSICTAEYAGSALLEDVIFAEFTNLLYRVLMTTAAPSQAAALDVIHSLTTSYGDRLLAQDENGLTLRELTPEAKLSQCVSLVVVALKPTQLGPGTAEDKAAVLRNAYASYLAISRLLNPKLRAELCATAFFTYNEVISDETQGVDLVSPSLTALKDLCEEAALFAENGTQLMERTAHGFISAAVNTVDSLRARTGPVIETKTKNSLLATTVAITALAASTPLSEVALDEFCFRLTTKLRAPEVAVSLTAVQCVRSLLLASARGEAALRFCVGKLLPQLVALLTSDDVEELDGRVADEVLKCLVGLVSSAQDGHRARLLAVVIPTCIALLPEAGSSSDDGAAGKKGSNTPQPSPISASAVQQLLAIATQFPAAFRQVAAQLDAQRRERLESAIRAALAGANQGHQPSATRQEHKTIALKSFG